MVGLDEQTNEWTGQEHNASTYQTGMVEQVSK